MKINTATATAPLPLSDATLDELAGKLAADATIVGIGESTRFSRETFGTRDQLFRRLVRRHGFRVLAVQDSADVAAALDAYVRGGEGSAETALDDAWRPWRTAEMAAALEWIREFNRDHPHDPVRILGMKPPQAQPADYDAVMEYVRDSAPERLAEVASHLDTIRTAHRMDEHVQRAQGTHPGRPFAEHARDARALIRALPAAEGRNDDILERMDLIVDFHEQSVAGRGHFVGDDAVWAGVIGDFQRRTGLRVVVWDGIGHTSAAEVSPGMVAPERGPQPTVGSVLREGYGARYVSVAIGFHHGDLGVVAVPEPAEGFIDAKLGEFATPAHWLDLRDEAVRGRWDGPAKARVISGVYDPSRDATQHLAVASLADAFDVLIHIREASPVQWLP
ncbi:erythromycin esterase family protein [Streptomyces rectiverticillatus]|uniref:erythromycin esterase family protein n=1 Tax=Streptomyces rectiverticillatus TaxID=173860 RepID=UPI0015C39DBF|nr:erythromycin esterase family protein [Streptomyces rectiverticillatus]QLE73253.1 erythromycin esterase family protein [Streptomyces rectiverticillatus]